MLLLSKLGARVADFMKQEIRILGIDDGSFSKKDKKVLIAGVVMRGNSSVDGTLSSEITVDGLDSTEKIIEMVNKSKHKGQLKCIMTHGSTLGGFNLIDISEIYKKTKIPVIAVVRREPKLRDVLDALKNLPHEKERIVTMKNCGDVHKYKKIYFQVSGLELHEAQEIIDKSIKRGNFPEPVRMAHIIASGITKGESHGRP